MSTTYRGVVSITTASRAFLWSKNPQRFIGLAATVEVTLDGNTASARVVAAEGMLAFAVGEHVEGLKVTRGERIELTHEDKNVRVKVTGEETAGSLAVSGTVSARSLAVKLASGLSSAGVAGMLKRVNAAPVENPGPAPVPAGRPVLAGSLTYAWPAAVQADTLLSELEAVRACGANGITMEVQGLDARMGQDSRDWKRQYAQCCDWAPEVVAAALNRGLMVLLYVWNSNTPGKGYKGSWKPDDVAGNRTFIRLQVAELLKRLPDDPRLLVVPCNEDDASTHPAIIAELVALCRGEVQHARLVASGNPTSWAKWTDRHPQKLADVKPQSDNTIITSDSQIIGELFEGGTWGTTPKPIVAKCAEFAKRNDKAGILAYYTTGSVPTAAKYQAEWSAVMQAARGGETTAPGGSTGTGPVLEWVKASAKEPYIEWACSPDVDRWPARGNVNGWIVIDGVNVEMFRPGYRKQHLNNAFGTGEHTVAIKKGQTVQIKLVAQFAKAETNSVPFVWPWRNTR